MKKLSKVNITDESIDNQFKAHRYNPAKVLSYKGKQYILPASDCSLYVDENYLYCMSIVPNLPFFALSEIPLDEEQNENGYIEGITQEIVLQYDCDTEEPLKIWEDGTEQNVLTYLLRWFE